MPKLTGKRTILSCLALILVTGVCLVDQLMHADGQLWFPLEQYAALAGMVGGVGGIFLRIGKAK